MKQRNPVLAAAFLALPALAISQTSGTEVYGRLDMSANYQQYASTTAAPAQHRSYATSDTSWLGFRGTEDLGGGNRTYFKIEHGFQADTGAMTSPVGQFWNREAFVGLGSAALGSIQLGSQFTPGVWMTLKVDPFRRGNIGAMFPLFMQPFSGVLGYPSQYNNAVQYISPNLAGVTARVMVAATEGVAPGGHPTSANIEYAAGRLFLGANYDHLKVTAAAGPGAAPLLIGAKETTYQLGATYRFDGVKLHGYYIKTKVEGSTGMTGGMLGVSVPLGAGEIAASVQRRNVSDAANSDAQLFALQYTHFLSKRTSVYAGGGHQTNHGVANYGVWPSRVDSATLPTAGSDVTGYQIGIRHFF